MQLKPYIVSYFGSFKLLYFKLRFIVKTFLTKLYFKLINHRYFLALKQNMSSYTAKYGYEFLYVILSLGLMLSIIAHTLFNFDFSIPRMLGFGIFGYIIKVELPVIISSCLCGGGNGGGGGGDGRNGGIFI